MNGKSRPPVTVSTCTYRHFESVYKTIDSVLAQDYPNFEYIITDDGSDNFPEADIRQYIAERAPDLKLQIIHHEENVGTVRNLDYAWRQARGTYIADVAAGDTLPAPDTLSKIVEAMERTGCGVLSASRLMVDENGAPMEYLPHRIFRKRLGKLPCRKLYGMFVSGQVYAMFSGSSIAVRKDADEKLGGYDMKYRLWEDGPFIAKALHEGAIGTDLDLTIVNYEYGGISTGGSHPLLDKDVELYNRTDRIEHESELSRFRRALLKVNLEENRTGAALALRHPLVTVYKLGYRALDKIGRKTDQMYLKKKGNKA